MPTCLFSGGPWDGKECFHSDPGPMIITPCGHTYLWASSGGEHTLNNEKWGDLIEPYESSYYSPKPYQLKRFLKRSAERLMARTMRP